MADGIAMPIAKTHMNNAVSSVKIFAPSLPLAACLLIGLTIAQYLSALKAVKVKTDTPIDTSFAHSDT